MSNESEPKVNLKNPFLAAFLAFLIPGAGHLYQGRMFKAVVYFFCIIGIFIWGMTIGEWQVLFVNVDHQNGNPQKDIGFYTQVFVGVPGLYAIYQSQRYYGKDNIRKTSLDSPLKTSFEGVMENTTPEGNNIRGNIRGEINLTPVRGELNTQSFEGTFRGTINEKEGIELSLGRSIELGKPIGGTRSRDFECDIVTGENGQLVSTGKLEGSIPRSFTDYFGSPVTETQLQSLNGKLGKRYDLAKVFTWIAGLLNLLAIWDAFDGPAYGYGREEEQQPEKKKEPVPA